MVNKQLNDFFANIQKKTQNLRPILEVVAAVIKTAIDTNFEYRGRWDGQGTGLFNGGEQTWAPLAPFTQQSYADKGYELNPTLERTGQLRRAVDVSVISNTSIAIANPLPYARIHQEGGKIPITDRMRRYFWFRYYDSEGEGEQWRNFALTKKTVINMPARPYITLTTEDVQDIIDFFQQELFTS